MAGQLPSFLSGAKLAIRIGSKVIAYAQQLSFSDDMTIQPVAQIGAYNFQALEPTNYIGRGSMTVTHYSNVVLSALKQADENLSNAPSNLRNADTTSQAPSDGNSLLYREFFSPVNLLFSRTFDIDVYERKLDGIDDQGNFEISNFGSEAAPASPIYRIQNCRLNNYNIGFTPGSLVNETVSFITTSVLDSRAGEISKVNG